MIRQFSTPVDTFIPNITCEIPKWRSFQNASTKFGPLIQFELDIPTCSVRQVTVKNGAPGADVVAAPINDQYCTEDCLPYPTSFTIQRVNCADPSHRQRAVGLDSTTPHDFRFAVIAANISEHVANWSDGTESDNIVGGNASIINAGVILYNINYNIVKAIRI